MDEEVITRNTAWEQKENIFFKKIAYLSVSAVVFREQFLAYAVRIGRSAFLCKP